MSGRNDKADPNGKANQVAGQRTPYAYAMTPLYPDPPGTFRLASAAVMTCMATGRPLSGSGGGGLFLAPEIVHALRNEGVGKAVVFTADWDKAVDTLRQIQAMGGAAGALATEALTQIDDPNPPKPAQAPTP